MNGKGGSFTCCQVHGANGATHGNAFMIVDAFVQRKHEALAPVEGSPTVPLRR